MQYPQSQTQHQEITNSKPKGYVLLLIAGIGLALMTALGMLLRIMNIIQYPDAFVQIAPYFLPDLLILTAAILAIVFSKHVGGKAIAVLVLGSLAALIKLYHGFTGIMVFLGLSRNAMASLTPLYSIGQIITGLSFVLALLVVLGAILNLRSSKTVQGPAGGAVGVYGAQSVSTHGTGDYAGGANYAAVAGDAPNIGFAVLGFFIPLVGLILFLMWKDQSPLKAKSCGKGALIGVIVNGALSCLLVVLAGVISTM